MKLLNCSPKEFVHTNINKRIIIFGCGNFLKAIEYSELRKIKDNVIYLVDTEKQGELINMWGRVFEIYSPEKIREEDECVRGRSRSACMYDMYHQLADKIINPKIVCYAFPFMNISDASIVDKNIYCEMIEKHEERIPKIIHTFWFSGDEKPKVYRDCLDTWSEYLPDYKIIEWNLDNYDYKKNPFVQMAIEKRAWAFAADFARLDVVSKYGGFYMDMDMEVKKSFNSLLGNKGIFSFSDAGFVNLAAFGAERGNQIVRDMLKCYYNVNVPEEKDEFRRFFQPTFILPVLESYGIDYGGKMQECEENFFLPRCFFFAMDSVRHIESDYSDKYTFAIHRSNVGWKEEDYLPNKIKKNRELWNEIAKYN